MYAKCERYRTIFLRYCPDVTQRGRRLRTKYLYTANKGSNTNYATEIDIKVENTIVNEIHARFPGHNILAEEAYSTNKITAEPIWIIDPICGTFNLSRGMKNYCTNIALAVGGELVAALVIDYSQNDNYWSVGKNIVYSNNKPIANNEHNKGVCIDVDLGALTYVNNEDNLNKYFESMSRIAKYTDFMMCSLNTSLSFAYVATKKIDGFVNIYTNPWDIAASAFLIQQSGGIITEISGKPWHLQSDSAIAAINESVHKTILEAFVVK